MTAAGDQNPYALHRELGELMTTKVGVVRDNRELDAADAQLQDLLSRFNRIDLGESSPWANQTLAYARQVQDMAQLARVIARSAQLPGRVPRGPPQTRVRPAAARREAPRGPGVRRLHRTLEGQQRPLAQDHRRHPPPPQAPASATRR